MVETDEWRFVEVASRRLQGFRNRVVQLDEVEPLLREFGGAEFFSSCYLFDEGLVAYVKERGGRVGGYRGPCWSRICYVDLDAWELGRALATARDLCSFYRDYWGAGEEAVFPFFSGQKGFHVGIHTGVFGDVEPGERLPDVLHRVMRAVVSEARPRYSETLDWSVGRRLGLLRVGNTHHGASGYYKVPLTLHELMNCEPDEIRALARSPREAYFTDGTGLVPLYNVERAPDAADLYADCLGQIDENGRRRLPQPEAFLKPGGLTDALCDAEMVLYHQGVPDGARSWTALRLASRMRCAGYGEDEAASLVLDWNEECEPPMEGPEVERIVGVAYRSGMPYQFGCGSGQDDPATARVYEACPYTDRSQCPTYRAFDAERVRADRRE